MLNSLLPDTRMQHFNFALPFTGIPSWKNLGTLSHNPIPINATQAFIVVFVCPTLQSFCQSMVYVYVFVFYASLNQVSKYPCQSKDIDNKYSYPCIGCLFMYNHMLFTCESICQHLFMQKGLYLFFYLVSCPCVSVTLNVNTTVLFFSCGQGSREF